MRKNSAKIVYAIASLLLGLLAATQLHAQSGSRNALPSTSSRMMAPPQPIISSSQNFGTMQSMPVQQYSPAASPLSSSPASGSCPTCSGSSQPNFASTQSYAPQSYVPQQSFSSPSYAQPAYSTQQYAAPMRTAPIYSAPIRSTPVYTNRVYSRPVSNQYFRSQPARVFRSTPMNYGYRGVSGCSGY